MTAPPLPASPCVRVKLDYSNADGADMGSRFYLSYTGSAPTAADCVSLAGSVAGYWNITLNALVQENTSLVEVDVLDIASLSGHSGLWSGSNAGTDSSGMVPLNAATNVEYQISRRYRGGKPRMFIPPPGASQMASESKWTSGFTTNVNTQVTAFFNHLEGLSIGAMGTLAHVNLSFYKGFTNITNSSGRERAVPTYRASALLDTVTGYAAKAVIGSQRRRRTATTY